MPQIHFNGKTYNDLAEMPATEREAYEQLRKIFKDENQDGTPDIFQGDVIGNIINAALTSPVTVDGRQVSGLGEMTPEQRAKLEKGLSKLKEWGLISQLPDLSDREQAPTWADAEIRPSQPIIQQPSAIQEDAGPQRMLFFVILAAALVCGVGVVVYLILQQGL